MSFVENEFNKRFGQEQLPKGNFDSDELWDAISNDMIEAEPKPSKLGFANWRLMGLLFFLLSIGFAGVLYINNKSIDKNLNVINAENDFESVGKNKSLNTKSLVIEHKLLNVPIEHSIKIDNSEVQEITDENGINNVSQILPHRIYKTIDSAEVDHSAERKTSFVNENENADLQKASSIDKEYNATAGYSRLKSVVVNDEIRKEDKSELTLKSNLEQTILKGQDLLVANTIEEANTSASLKIAVSDQVRELPANLFYLNRFDRDLPNLDLPLQNRKKSNNEEPRLLNITIFGGVNRFKLNYSSDNSVALADLKNATDSQFWGTTYGVNVGLVTKKNLLFNLGIEYHDLWSKFDYESVEEVSVFKENYLLKVWIDSMTGDTLNEERGDTTVNVTSTRTVLHYNNYKRWSVPIEIGLQHNSNKLTFGFVGGIVLNFNQAQSGRTIDRDSKIVAFNNDAASPLSSFNVGFRISPKLTFETSKDLSFVFSPQMMWSPRQGIGQSDLKVGQQQINFNVGLMYSFN